MLKQQMEGVRDTKTHRSRNVWTWVCVAETVNRM
jgi:hypothetical protein